MQSKSKTRSKEPKMPKGPPVPERVIQAAILEYLRQQPNLDVWRMPNGGVAQTRNGKRFFSPSPVAGFPDVFGCLAPSGRLFAFEIKAKDGKLSEVQAETLERLANCGALVGVVRSLEDVMALLRTAQ